LIQLELETEARVIAWVLGVKVPKRDNNGNSRAT
jgi:hypothetical protein